MQIIPITSTKDISDFHRVPFIIYKSDPNWIPHLKQDIDKIFDPKKNKFWKNGEAIRWVLKNKNGDLIGRVAAFVNRKLSDTFKQPTGGFGFFECVDDQSAANLLFDTCKDWLIAKGMKAMDGPINFGEKDNYWGLMISNFDNPATYAMNYNPAYYRKLFDAYGFKTYYEQYVFQRPVYLPTQESLVKKSDGLRAADSGYHCKTIDPKNLPKFAEDFRTIYNNAWGGHSGFKPMEKEQALNIMSKLKPVLDPDIVFFAYYKEDPIGFYVNIPELNELFKYVNGNLNWWGKIKFMYHKLKGDCKTMYSIVFGVVREHQGKGVEGFMIKFAEGIVYPKRKYTNIILTWIGDFNPKMLKVIDNLECTKWRTYITCRIIFDPEIPFERAPIIE
jgi:hypothetical protein